jgi:hypothetical protein
MPPTIESGLDDDVTPFAACDEARAITRYCARPIPPTHACRVSPQSAKV